jgi:hypothetical protein
MRPIRLSVTGSNTSASVPLDQYQTPFNVSLSLQIGAGAILATVSYTFDDIFDSTVTPLWTNHVDLTAQVAAAIGSLISPVRAVRLVNADTGTAVLIIQQAGAQ